MASDIGISKWRVWLWSYAPLFIWIGVIFYLSSDSGSMSNTSRFLRPILVFLFPSAGEATLLFYHGVIRKLAHFTEYAVLGALAVRAFEQSGRYLYAMLIVFAVAAADEFGQSFRPNRTGSLVDVAIDVFGGLFAIAVCWSIFKYKGQKASIDLIKS